jgi:hypothetical protein
MIASRRIFIVSSSHPYHNCKIPFLYEHIMTPFMTPPGADATYSYYPSHHAHLPRISSLHQSCSPSIRIPYQSRSSRAVSLSLVRDLSACDSFDKPKVLYHPITFRLLSPQQQWVFGCTLYIMYYQSCRFLSYLYQYLLRYPGYSYYSDAWNSFLFFIVLWVVLVAFSGNNASLHFGIGVLFHCGLHL